MTKSQALALIDAHKNKLIDPVEMLQWTWLRVIIVGIPEKMWEDFVDSATEKLSR